MNKSKYLNKILESIDLENYLKYIQESYFLSDKIISIDLDKFISGEKNKLFISGLSGSGKTTICRKLAQKYNAVCVESDNCKDYISKEDYDLFRDPNKFIEDSKKQGDSKIKQVFLKVFKRCIKPKIDSPSRMIIEGGLMWQSAVFYDNIQKLINSYPALIMGTAALKATFMAYQRGVEKKPEKRFDLDFIYRQYLKNFKLLHMMHEKFKNRRMEAGGNVKVFEINQTEIPNKWRPRVEVYVIKDKKILVGIHPEIGLHVPGGGIEEGQDLIKAAKNECLEEAGIIIDNVKLITNDNYYEDWYKLVAEGQPITKKDRMRMTTFRGIKHHYLQANFVGFDKSRLGADNDALKRLRWISIEDLIKEYKKQGKVFDPAQYDFRINVLKKIKF